METLKGYIIDQVKKYPKLELQDLVKLIYQNTFGPGHLVTDALSSLERLKQEYKEVMGEHVNPLETQVTTYEKIGNGLVRVNLKGLEEKALPIINRMFVITANDFKGSQETFLQNLELLVQMSKNGEIPFNLDQVKAYLEVYKEKGYPCVSHSEVFKANYEPSYRVIASKYIELLEVCTRIETLLTNKKQVIVGIDGPCGSGKTTLASLLAKLYEASTIHMDDFFLPPDLRTKERLEEVGGNVHYERFEEEVIKNLKSGMPFSYRPFKCMNMAYGEDIQITPTPLTIIEGSYSMREEFRLVYDLKLFKTISKEEQISRILKRNGPEQLVHFINKWIPKEEAYFKEKNILQCVDLIL